MHLERERHAAFVARAVETRNLLYCLTVPFRLNTMYWSVNALSMLGEEALLLEMQDGVVAYVLECRNEDGGFGGCRGYPSNVTSTFNALQILYMCGHEYWDLRTAQFVAGMLQPEGCFHNDMYGEVDTRINCCGVLALHLLSVLRRREFGREALCRPVAADFLREFGVDAGSIVSYTMRCWNADGGFGAVEGAESHAAQTFCCLSTLRSLDALHLVDRRSVSRFVAMIQRESGGLSGRINKKEDVCYSFWAYSSLVMVGEEGCINQERLREFILSCQGGGGGFSDRPGNEADLYHLMFALAGLSLLDGGLLDPGFAL